MIHIEVDYKGPRSVEVYDFVSTGSAYMARLDEIEAYTGKIDRIRVYTGSSKVNNLLFDQHGIEVLIDTTSVGVALRKARRMIYT